MDAAGFRCVDLLLLVGTVGVYRWSRILTGLWRYEISGLIRLREKIGKTAMRAHANCVENLPVFATIVFALYVANVTSSLVNILAIAILIARVLQSLVHVCFVQTNTVASIRFAFFGVQIIGFLALIGIIVTKIGGNE